MKAIISSLVDPEGKNNDYNLLEKNAVTPGVALKLLRLVAPKCQVIDGKIEKACNIFNLTLAEPLYRITLLHVVGMVSQCRVIHFSVLY